MPLRRIAACTLGLSSVLLACTSPTEGEVGAGAALVGGREVNDGEWSNVVHLGLKTAAGDVKWGCTGTLIDATHVLTAAHCIEKIDVRECLTKPGGGRGPGGGSPGGDPFIRELAEGFEPASSFLVKHPTLRDGDRAKRLAVRKVWVHPRFRDDMIGWADAALLELAEPIAGVTPVPLLVDFAEERATLKKGARATLVGFGKTSLLDLDGEKRKARVGDVTIRRFNASEVDLGGGEDVAASPGDSGGPAFVKLPNGQLRQLGITSRGPQDFSISKTPAIYGLTRYVACGLQAESGVTLAPGLDCRPPEVFTYTPAALAALDFEKICSDSSATPDQKHTVLAVRTLLAEEAGTAPTSITCAHAAERLRGRTSLDLSSARIRDVSPLASLSDLETLSLEYDEVTTVAPLARLAKLKELRLGWNDVRDLGALAAREAAGLVIRGKPMQRATYAQTAFLKACKDPNATPSQKQTVAAIQRFFWYPDEPPTGDPCVVANRELVVTRILTVQNPKWSAKNRISCEVEMTFPAEPVVDLGPLAGLEALEELYVAKTEDAPNAITDVRPLATLPNLRTLDLTGNPVSDVSPLDALVREGLKIKR